MAIHIKPSHKGLLHERLGIKKNKKIPESRLEGAKREAKKTGNVKELRQAVFAENARHWNHGG